MTWFKVDDGLAFHVKALRAGNAALGLWVRAGAWCSQHLTDGEIPGDIALTMGQQDEIDRLVKVGLWTQVDDETYQFHDWCACNPSRAEVEGVRKRERDKKAAARAKRAGSSQLSLGGDWGPFEEDDTEDDQEESRGESPDDTPTPVPPDIPGGQPEGIPTDVPGGVRSTRPVPSRPVHQPPHNPRKRGSRVPEDFTPSPADHAKARQLGFTDADLDRITAEFIDYWRGIPGQRGVKLDWDATWRNRIRDVAERRPPRRLAAARPNQPGPKPWEL